MKIVVTGAGGRLGGALARLLVADHAVSPLTRSDLDLGDAAAVDAVVGALDFDVLINPAALTSVDASEERPAEAMAVNAHAPGRLASIARAKGARMIHVSTDYVFDGKSDGLRVEDDPTEPLGAYGRSKLAGERAVLAESPDFLVVRTSWVFGPDRDSFVESIIRRAMENNQVEAICDKYSTPCYSEDFVGLLGPVLENPGIAGVLHLCNRGATSWQAYGQCALDVARELGAPLRALTIEGIRLADMSAFTGPRPVHTAMSTGRYESLTGIQPRAWATALQDYLERSRPWEK